jgi:tetratricopeptide (TPR) repeat protein
MGVAFHLSRPAEESPQFVALAPHEFPEFHEADLLHLHTSVGLDAPEKVWATPWSQAMATGSVPEESDLVAHGVIITTKGTKVHEGKSHGQAGPAEVLRSVMLKFRLCLDLFRMTDANTRQRAEDLYYSALDLMAEGHLEKAIASYQESLTADPTFTEAMHGLARALQDLQRFDEAIEVARRITEIDPDDVLAHTSLSVLYQKKGMIPEAEAEGAKARVLGWKQQLKKGT